MTRKITDFKLMSYNVHGSMTLAGLSMMLEVFKPSVVMLQEVRVSTEQLQGFLARLGYTGQSNVDESELTKPGTGMVWKTSVNLTQVVPIYACRIQMAKLGKYRLVNVYVPAGNNRKAERRRFFTELLFGLLAGLEGELPILGGDWNCVVDRLDLEDDRYFNEKKSVDLTNILAEFELVDTFRYLYGRRVEFSWRGRDNASKSRLDRFYIPRGMVRGLKSVRYDASLSDHSACTMVMNLARTIKGRGKAKFQSAFWKLNTRVLEDVDFGLNFNRIWEDLLLKQGDYVDVADWWDLRAKPAIRQFLMDFSAARAKTRRDTKEFLYAMLNKGVERGDVSQITSVRGKLQDMLREDHMGFVIRSRFQENIEAEKASIYHMNREKKNAKAGNLEQLMIGGVMVEDKQRIENHVTRFYTKLFHGYHGPNGKLMGEPFEPDFGELDQFLRDLPKLSAVSRDKMTRPVSLAELEFVLKKASNNKSPGLDGLPYEFYKSVKEVVGDVLVEIMNCQLDRLNLVQSNKEGATRLPSKLSQGVVPRVDQLRPITLLCCDYKLLTMILSNRMLGVLGEVITSGQLCSVKGQNIHYGVHNLMAGMIYLEERMKVMQEEGWPERTWGGGVLVSYDLFKAYDRVSIPYLCRVLEAMGFGDEFVNWVVMLHQGVTTRFILQSLSKPVDIRISVRQGDPIAMVLFLVYVEPLLVKIRSLNVGLRVVKLDVWGGGDHEYVCQQRDEDYVDDIEVLLGDPQDMVLIDDVFQSFERMSGAILNRSSKTKLLGLGRWRDRQVWPLSWMKVETSLRVFGLEFFPEYAVTLDSNWGRVFDEVQQCLFSWSTRVLNSVYQRVQVINTFVLPKLWYMAEALPLPEVWARQFDRVVYVFIKKGKMEMLRHEVLYNPVEMGGLGLVCVRAKADALFLKQAVRMLDKPQSLMFTYIGHFGGRLLNRVQMGRILWCHTTPPFYAKLVELLLEAEELGLVNFCCKSTLLRGEPCQYYSMGVTAKEIYGTFAVDFPPPRIEYRRELEGLSGEQWENLWVRVSSNLLDPEDREVVWRAVNDILPTRERLARLGVRDLDGDGERRVENVTCNRCDLGQRDSVTHMFTECGLVREAWVWVRRRMLMMMPGIMAAISNYELIHMLFEGGLWEKQLTWIMGTYMGWVFGEAVIKGRCLSDSQVRGYLRYKFLEGLKKRMPDIGYIPEFFQDRDIVFDNG